MPENSTSRHLDRLIKDESISIIDERKPKIEQLRFPSLGNFSCLRHIIEENQDSDILAPLLRDDNKNNQYHFQAELINLLKSYHDILYTNESNEKLDEIQQAYVTHVLDHLTSSRSKIISNNKKKKGCEDDDTLRDQGFTRAKVLFLLPFRYHTLRLGKCFVKNLEATHEIIHFDRLVEEFGNEDGTDDGPIPCNGSKPIDFYQTFNGNIDDSFRVGIKITKSSVKFFADFYDSDIICASPLGLKTLISPEEHKEGDQDFLSSIEIIIFDQAEIFLFQNWALVIDIMKHVNVMPSKPGKMDISRVRMWHLENWSKYYRQLIMFSSITFPLAHSFFQTFSTNYEGYLLSQNRIEHPLAKSISSKCTQHFLYFDCPSAKESCDNRFNFFIKHVLPRYTASGNKFSVNDQSNNLNESIIGPLNHTLIFVSSYFDYVRLRNYFRREKLSFTQTCEYTEDNKTSKARQLFYFGARQFLIYTERCHFYRRYKLKGVRNIIFYEPPVFSKFYAEMLDMMKPELQGEKFMRDSAAQFTATTLFSNHDTFQLGAILGLNNAVKLIQNKKSIK